VGLTSDGCDLQFAATMPEEVSVLLVIDQSFSMNDTPAGYRVSKWEALHMALGMALDWVKGGMRLGLELFPTTGTAEPIPPDCAQPCCIMPSGSQMNIALDWGTTTVPAILQTLESASPAGATPMAVALSRAYDCV
jgi:hypothetical protein